MVHGQVREFDPDLGFGVIDADETPGGCWVHYSVIRMPGFAMLQAGDRVNFQFETFVQDGYAYRATNVLVDGVDAQGPILDDSGQSSEYGSKLTFFRD